MYKLTSNTSIVRLSDNANIPADPANNDYRAYLEWMSKGNVAQSWKTDAELLQDAKDKQKNGIRSGFSISSILPVAVNGISFNGGMDSAIKLDTARRMAELSGASTVVFYDATNTPLTFTIQEATNIVVAIVNEYQTLLSKKQTSLNNIDKATTIKQVNVVKW